ncbi:transmembrane protein 60 isoform X1 [Acinonyx jubatus]|uniref:Transmembrane protein 60 isoform X1 n=1 Tax=Acinonyx jubatus TaxID=32536 RepID=A0ABM3PS96_ACIJB|nr:transmembrane protein 60 isoform X1 [Acinonyx jubatus]XP_053074550.1 transmembrane protein 60 isoform X1 [Acinonyx jubatus]
MGSRGGKLSLCHRSNDGRGPRLTPARRCQRLPGKSPAAEGDALARSPHLHPARRFPLSSCSIPRILSEPNDLHTARPSTEVMPALTVGAGAARRRLGCARETPKRAPPPLREPEESQRGCRRERCLQSCRPTPSPAGFCAGACSLRAPAGRGREGAGRPRGRSRELAGLIGTCGPNGTTDTPGCA